MKRTMRIAAILLFAVLACASFQAQNAGTVTKTAQGNPSLGIVRFSGAPEARTVLETMLRKCDWFQVQKDAAAERAQVQLEVIASENAYMAEVKTPAEGKTFRLEEHGTDWNDAAAKAVDAVLGHFFGVPAYCASPIVYVMTDAAHGKKELFSCRIDGSGSRRLTYNEALSSEPSWGHAGALVYTLNKNNALSVVLMDMARGRQRKVSGAKGLNASPALSRDGRFIALPLSLGNQVDLYLLDLAADRKTRLTEDRNVESSPVFSPDGTKICFVSDKSGRPQLYLVPAAGGEAVRLTKGASECVSPDWSARAGKLCYATKINGQYVIAVMDPENPGDAEVVTEAAGNWEAPSWAPDGRHVICTRSTGGKQDLYLVDTRLHAFQAISGGVKVSLPAWSPAR